MHLQEYYEIVDDARPLSGFLPTHADFFYGNAFLIMKLSKHPSFKVSQSTFEFSYFLIICCYLILRKFCSVLTLGIGLL